MTNLEINNAYVGDTQAEKIYLGTDVVWQPASSGNTFEVVWDSASTPDWYFPSSSPADAYHKSRCKAYFNGQEIESGDTGLRIAISSLDTNEWIEPTHMTDSRDTDGWINIYWHNGGEITQGGGTCASRGFNIDAIYVHDNQTYAFSTTFEVSVQSALTFYGWYDRDGAILAVNLPMDFQEPDSTLDETLVDITYSCTPSWLPQGQSVSGSIANQYNSYNHGNWHIEFDQDEDMYNYSLLNAGWQGNSYLFQAYRTGGTGNDELYFRARWAGFEITAMYAVIQEPVDPYFLEPLTMVIQDPGSGSTTGLMWRLSGVSSASEVSQSGRSIYYTLNGGPLTLVEMTGTPTTSKTVDVVIATGLSQGDVFIFYGASSAVGAYGFASGSTDGPFHYFVNYAGMQAVVLGNIKSLLTDESTWNAMKQYHDKEGIDNIHMDDRAFMNLFQGKTGFTFNEDATHHLVLPDRNLSTYCFKGLFNGCTRMTTAPELPATALTDSCYREMFFGCTSLTSAPALPAETLAANCYRSMFNGCTSLTAATTLPALSVPDYAYLSMFADTSIATAPALPATNLGISCYSNMFRGCSRLTNMPELPATTLAASCYTTMFSACTSLTATTVLPAPTLVNGCYQYMFRGCTNLAEVTCLATDVSATNSKQYWLQNVSSTGTFYKDPNMTGWSSGVSGIPTGWTVEDYVEPTP